MKKVFSVVLLAILIVSLSSGCFSSSVSISENLINQIHAGYLYTSMYKGNSEETTFQKDRVSAVNKLIDAIEATAGYSFKVADGLISYENNLLSYIDKIENKDDNTLSDVKKITDTLFTYKIILDSKENEIKAYLDMKPKEKSVKATVNSYLLYAVCELTDMQKEYLNWLMTNTPKISELLQSTSSRQAEKVISTSESTYRNKIKGNLNKMMFEYEKAAMMNSYLISADYYASGYFLQEAKITIDTLKSHDQSGKISDQLLMIESLYLDISNNIIPPVTLKNPPVNNEVHFLLKTVSAADNEISFLGTGVSTLDGVSATDDEKYDKNENYGVPESVEQPSSPPLSPEATEMSNPIKLTIDNSKLNQLVIFGAQTEISSLNWTISSQYAEIVKLLADRISNIKKDISDEQKQNIKNLIENELTDLLGGKKSDFVDKFLNSSASELITAYNNWISTSDHTKDMNFDKNDLINLLNAMGVDIKAEEISEAVTVSPSPSPNAMSTPVLTSSPSPSDSPAPSEEVFMGDVTHIVASYELLKSLSSSESNENILAMVYGWEDPIDYSNLKKEESKDNSGNINAVRYYENNMKTGWQLTISGESLEYNYYMPGISNAIITIIRKGTYESSQFYSLVSTDEESNRRSYLRFKEADGSNKNLTLQYAGTTENNQNDGLFVEINSDTQFTDVTSYSLGKVLDSYQYHKNILIEEVHNQYIGDNVILNSNRYFENGNIKFVINKRNGKSDGVQITYNEDGKIVQRIEYKEGYYHGKWETFYDDGSPKELISYTDGKKNGDTFRNYENGQTEFTGKYLNDQIDGVWFRFLEDGTPVSEIGYKEGVSDGIYHLYATGNQSYNSIHTIGQYSEGKKTGIWYYGYNNEGYVEKYLYENDVKIWQEAGNTRTYYNPDGSVKSTEKIN